MIQAKAIIFDRDGVIIDTDSAIADSMLYGLRALGINATEKDVPLMAGKSIDTIKEYLLSKWDFNFDEFRNIQRKYYYDNIDNVPFFTDVIEYIKRLHSEGKAIALTTSAAREGTLLLLGKVDLLSAFKVIVVKEDCTKHKPDPEPYLLTAQKLGLKPEDCVVIEDSETGVKAAKSANMYCIAIPNSHTKDQDFSSADAVVKSISEIDKKITIL